jgi:ribosomal protein L37E
MKPCWICKRCGAMHKTKCSSCSMCGFKDFEEKKYLPAN